MFDEWHKIYRARVEKVIESYLRLRDTNPDHELLSLVNLIDNKRGFVVTQEFREGCTLEGDPSNYNALGRDGRAMRSAAEGKEYEFFLISDFGTFE
jgi:hypothetical protein